MRRRLLPSSRPPRSPARFTGVARTAAPALDGLFSLTRTGFRRRDVCTTTARCSGARKSSLIEYFLCSPFFLRFAQVTQRAYALFLLTCRHARSAWQVLLRRQQVSAAHHLLQHHDAQHHGAQHHPEAGASRRVGTGTQRRFARRRCAGPRRRRCRDRPRFIARCMSRYVTGDGSHRWRSLAELAPRGLRARGVRGTPARTQAQWRMRGVILRRDFAA